MESKQFPRCDGCVEGFRQQACALWEACVGLAPALSLLQSRIERGSDSKQASNQASKQASIVK